MINDKKLSKSAFFKKINQTVFSAKILINKNRIGFTLIELLVVIAVLAMLAVLGVAAYVTFSRNQTINAAAGDVVSLINLAKSRASSQVKPDSCNAYTLSNYEVRICGSSPSCQTSGSTNVNYELDVNCGANIFPISYRKLPNGYSFDATSTTHSIIFQVINGGVVGSGMIVISGNGAANKTITVDQDGNISVSN